MSRRLFAAILAVLLLIMIFPPAALAAASVTVKASPSRVEAGNMVSVSGTAEANELLSVKVTDKEGNIVYYGVARANGDGTYQSSFVMPDLGPQMLTVVAGSGSDVATAQVEVFIQKYCTVIFNKNGGDTEASPTAVIVKESEAINSLPTAPVKEGYIFDGWYLEKDCNTAWDSSNNVTTDITVYAKWTVRTYTVKFFQMDGKTQIGHTQTVRWGKEAIIETAPAYSGFEFDHWALTGADDTVETSLTSVKENITAVASYTKNDTEATKTPSPSARATVTASPTATANPAVSPLATATASPTASASTTAAPRPTASASATAVPTASATAAEPSATPNASILPATVNEDKNTGIITVVIDTDDLPEGTASVQLPDGRVVDLSGGGTITLEITDEDLDENGMARITALDDEGTVLESLSVQVFNKSGSGIVAVVLWIVGIFVGLFLLGIVFFVMKRRKKR